MSKSYDTDVLIAGAGPAGLVLGIELARRGIAFRLIEQRAEPLHASRGKGSQPRTLEIYEDIGALPGYLEISGPYPPLCMLKGDTVIGQLDSDLGFGLAIGASDDEIVDVPGLTRRGGRCGDNRGIRTRNQ